jgi:hypothetical protein
MKRISHEWHFFVQLGVCDIVWGGRALQLVLVVVVVVVVVMVKLDVIVMGGTVIGQEDMDPEEVDPEGQRVQVPHGFVLRLPLPLKDDEVVGHE